VESNQVEIEHLTAMMRGGLCRLAIGPSTPYFATSHLQCSTSILMAPQAALIEQIGKRDSSSSADPVVWRGDRNFYEGLSCFRLVRDWSSSTPLEQIPFDAWTPFWDSEPENSPVFDRVQWRRLPDPNRPVHAHTPADYLLDESSPDNPALGAADYGDHAGMAAGRLPTLPLDPVAFSPQANAPWR
jgi:hypothetical protein